VGRVGAGIGKIKALFLQRGRYDRDVTVLPPRVG